MSAYLWFLWVVSGGAVATWVFMRLFWIKDPIPGVMKYVGVLTAGIVGSVVGGGIAHALGPGSSDPMPLHSLVAALAVSLIFSGGFAMLGGGGGKVAR